jgi:poly(A) polymerase
MARKPRTASRRTPSSKASTSSTASSSKWIRIDRKIALPAYVKDAIQKLDDAGHVAYVVGGSVRDFILSRESKDHDVATSASPDELCELFPTALTVGKAFGVIKVPIASNEMLEIATFREDLGYTDFRHPKSVRFAGPEEDAKRRDFTVNALFYDPKTDRILDTVGGMEDLREAVVRAIGDPLERFREDALRLLRAVRFVTALGFSLDKATAEAIKSRARLITKISPERVREELTLMWTGPRPAEALKMLSELGLLPHLIPEIDRLRAMPSVWKHLMKALQALARVSPKRSAALAWAAILHDTGKPAAWKRNEGKNFAGHEAEGKRIAESVGSRFKLSRADIQRMAVLIEDHLKFKDVFQMREATLERFVREAHFEELLALHCADAAATDGNLAFYEFCKSRFDLARSSPMGGIGRLVDGTDLIQLGFKPGPEFSEILRVVEDLALEKKLRSKEQALEYVIRHFVP